MSRAVADDLRAVRERLVTHGWTQGESHSSDGRCCILGALSLNLPATVDHANVPRRQEVRRALWRVLPPTVEISTFNDAPGRTFADVLALLDKAIAAEEARP